MKPNPYYLKKRKLSDVGLPAPKHICCEATDRSERANSLCLNSADVEDEELLDMLVESTQDSNSLPGDSLSSTSEVIFDDARFMRKMDSYDEASTSWANSRSITSGNENGPFSLESRNTRIVINDNAMEDCKFSCQQIDGSGWHDTDVDGLEECISTNYCKDGKQQTANELEEFISSSGVNTNLFMLSSDWRVDQEARMGRRKPTIDQEFEQYFSTLML